MRCECWAASLASFECLCVWLRLFIDLMFSEALTENASMLQQVFPEMLARYRSFKKAINLYIRTPLHHETQNEWQSQVSPPEIFLLSKNHFFKFLINFFHIHSWQSNYQSARVERWGDGPTFSLTFFQRPKGATHNGLFIALRCTLLCGCECLFSMCITHMECISEAGTCRNSRTDVSSLANCVVKATNVHHAVCLEEEKHTFPGRGWCREIKWLSAVCQSRRVSAVSFCGNPSLHCTSYQAAWLVLFSLLWTWKTKVKVNILQCCCIKCKTYY